MLKKAENVSILLFFKKVIAILHILNIFFSFPCFSFFLRLSEFHKDFIYISCATLFLIFSIKTTILQKQNPICTTCNSRIMSNQYRTLFIFFSFNSRKICIISYAVSQSKFPVGRSASKIFGLLIKALAIATLCLCPPERFGHPISSFLSNSYHFKNILCTPANFFSLFAC